MERVCDFVVLKFVLSLRPSDATFAEFRGNLSILPALGLVIQKRPNITFDLTLTRILTRAPLEYSAERATLGGEADFAPLPNSRTHGRSEVGKASNGSSR